MGVQFIRLTQLLERDLLVVHPVCEVGSTQPCRYQFVFGVFIFWVICSCGIDSTNEVMSSFFSRDATEIVTPKKQAASIVYFPSWLLVGINRVM